MLAEYAVPTVAFSSCDVVIVTAPATAMEQERVAPAERWSDTRRVKLKLPAVDGVPASDPVALIWIPAGREPDAIAHVYGPVPPVAASCDEYGWPAFAAGEGHPLTDNVDCTVILSGRSAVWLLWSDTRTVKLNAPALCGEPLIAPEPLSVRPPGSEPLVNVQEYGGVPPPAATVWL
jgi:hypothetical protein